MFLYLQISLDVLRGKLENSDPVIFIESSYLEAFYNS